MNADQSKDQLLCHHPVYLIRILYLLFARLPRFGYYILVTSFKRGRLSYEPSITDEHIFDIFIHGPLLVTAKVEEELLEINIPEMPLITLKGTQPGNFDLVFDPETKTIERAVWKGKDILEDKGRIASLLIMSLAMWAHPKTPVVAEMSAWEIARKDIQELETSNRFVLALHYGLLYGKLSPLRRGQPLSKNVDKASGLESAMEIKMEHRINMEKMKYRYFSFLMEPRKVLFRLLRVYEIDVNPEFLFNNIIIHSVDHHLLYQNLKKIPYWSLDGGFSLRSYWRSQMFLAVWVRHVTSPFEEERIQKLTPGKYPFYDALYKELAEIDLELANSILASTSF